MDSRYTRLLDAFGQAEHGPPADICKFLTNRPAIAELPPPWDTWTLIGLVRHRERQYWVLDIIRTRLRGDAAELATFMSLGHPRDIAQAGTVPGLPEWEYYFHGRGCCITHKVRGDAIDVDFFDDTAEYFDPYFYIWYLNSLRHAEPPEARLKSLHPSVRPISIAFTDLEAAGALACFRSGEPCPPRIADEVLACTPAIERFCDMWGDPSRRLWLAGLIGDWPAAYELSAGCPELIGVTATRKDDCRRLRRERLQTVIGYPAAEALHGLDDLGIADEYLEQVFRSPPSGQVSVALEIADRQNDPRWCPHIYALFNRINPSGQIPEPHIWTASLKLLLRHGYKPGELVSRLTEAGGGGIGEAVLLSLEHAPEHTLHLIRKALLSDIPINRIVVAAILAVIAKPWSTRELLLAINECDDQKATAEARAALLEVGGAEVEKAVLEWEYKNPHEEEAGSYLEINGRRFGPFFTFSELSLKNCASRIRYEMDKLHDRVMKLREVIPSESVPPPREKD
jgi:hypothetical protein